MKKKIKQSPKLPAETRREQLLKAAELLFHKQGYQKTTTDQIARKANLTKGALYHHFKSKDDILLALLNSIVIKYMKELDKIDKKNLTPVDILKYLIAIEHTGEISSIRHNLDLRAQMVKLPKIRKFVKGSLEYGFNVFAERLNPKYGRTKAQRYQVAVMTFCYFEGMKCRKQINPELIDTDKQLKTFESFFIKNKSFKK